VRAEWGLVHVQHVVHACFLMLGWFQSSSAFLCLISAGGESNLLDCWVLFCFVILYFRCSRLYVCYISSFWMTCLKILNVFWKGRAVVIKSREEDYDFFLEVLHWSQWGVTLCQPKIQQFPFLYHFLRKLKMPQLSFTFCWLPANKKFFPKGPKFLQNSSLTQASFITVHKEICII